MDACLKNKNLCADLDDGIQIPTSHEEAVVMISELKLDSDVQRSAAGAHSGTRVANVDMVESDGVASRNLIGGATKKKCDMGMKRVMSDSTGGIKRN